MLADNPAHQPTPGRQEYERVRQQRKCILRIPVRPERLKRGETTVAIRIEGQANTMAAVVSETWEPR